VRGTLVRCVSGPEFRVPFHGMEVVNTRDVPDQVPHITHDAGLVGGGTLCSHNPCESAAHECATYGVTPDPEGSLERRFTRQFFGQG